MSGRVAYLERTDRGFRPTALRLVGERSDDYLPFATDDPSGDLAVLARAADWIREHVPRGAPGIDVLCLDADGSLCSWLSSPSTEPGVVAALARHAGGEGWSGGEDGAPAADVLGAYAGLAQESSVQALTAPQAPTRRSLPGKKGAKSPTEQPRRRLAVVATPDATARVLLDELDLRALKVGSVCSLWHAMSAAWDPSGTVHSRAVGATVGQESRVVADSPHVHATVLVDPRGRLLWSWSGHAGILAGGSIRLRGSSTNQPEVPTAQVLAGDISRLASEWLAWSAQLGVAPSRVTCVVPEVAPVEGALGAREIGEALGSAWSGATVDLAVDNDPIGATLRRLAVAGSAAQDAGESTPMSPEDPTSSLVNLTHRPGRAHFRLYLWAALTLVVAAVGISAVAIQMWISASRTSLAAARTSEQWRSAFQTLKLPGTVFPGQELPALKAEVTRLENAGRLVTPAEPAMPVLQELETLSFVIGFEGVHLEDITLDSRLVKPRIVCQVPSIPDGEALFTAIKQVGGSNVTGWSPSYSLIPNGKTKCTFLGSWVANPTVAANDGGGT